MENHNLEETEITADLVYQSVDPSDFNAMLEVERYNDRTTAFDKIISATHNHFWDPMDTKYIDFSVPFDVENEYMINPDQDVDLRVIGDLLNEKDKIRLVNMNVHWSLSSILHGEQGALNLSSSLCHILKDPGAQEYAANQTREEARHVAGFSRYIHARWGQPLLPRERACGRVHATKGGADGVGGDDAGRKLDARGHARDGCRCDDRDA